MAGGEILLIRRLLPEVLLAITAQNIRSTLQYLKLQGAGSALASQGEMREFFPFLFASCAKMPGWRTRRGH